MRKLFIFLCISLLFISSLYASQFTTNYNLEIPAIGARDWQPIISNDIISIDTVSGLMSADIATQKISWDIISTDVGLQKISTDILSNDATIQNLRVDGISVDIGVMKSNTTQISTDIGVMKFNTSIISSDVGVIKVLVPIISNDTALMKQSSLEFFIDGGGAAITPNLSAVYLEVPFACNINSATLVVTPLNSATGSMTVDVKKSTYAGYPPTSSITGTNGKLVITSAVSSQDTSVTGWTKTLLKGDILLITADSATTVQKACVSLKVTKQ